MRVLAPYQIVWLTGLVILPLTPFMMIKYKPYDLAFLNEQVNDIKLPENAF